MTDVSRRRFLQLAAGTAAASSLSAGIARAASIPPAAGSGTLADVQHVVVLMQENRSFDHYFGTLRGVRGFGDPRPLVLPSGKTVFHQAATSGRETLPFRPDADDLGLKFIQDLDHSWSGTHAAWNGGAYDRWIPAKSTTTMAYLTREDIPYHYALADAFTVCDAYHCSMLSSTDPNRYYMYTGYTGNDGRGGGPVLGNEEAGYAWTTFPEILQQSGVSWKVYQDIGTGLDAAGHWGWTSDPFIGNYGDNSLLYFHNYRNAKPGDALYDKARTGTNAAAGDGFFDRLRADVAAGTLPQVSWIAAPEAFSEHPNWPANYGAWYISRVLDALTSNPQVWSRTALLVTYDENDGFFDHVTPPFPPASAARGLSTADVTQDLFAGSSGYGAGPYGLGPRVPMLVISPWSTGGWVCSQTFDHTSIVQFIEKRFGVHNPNVSAWRRAVCGDLTSAFDFSGSDAGVPALPDTTRYVPPNHDNPGDYVPAPPATGTLPRQESGLRNARPLPYDLVVDTKAVGGRMQFTFTSLGAAGAAFHVTSATRSDGPWPYTVEGGKSLTDSWALPGSRYDFSVHGPNGFLRRQAGTNTAVGPEVTARHDNAAGQVTLTFTNAASASVTFTATDAYAPDDHYSYTVQPGASRTVPAWGVPAGHHWYDLTVTSNTDSAFVRRFAGHVETGTASTSDPATTTT
ncbi:phospholipase C, phosphocholine-specific [Streptomyces malaysiensis subsp. malaysiensis]|uniref:phosphocholine-specific phospholipase C n=1 Tax=Streptomyces malaysiensis TaxID=92644 RepID=UPI000BFDD450|nr:phospholipase C, phosphocholine-specific [Streptomyces malaysiensis]QDL68257.1 phospholipase C, phosphocholine-specific [Streptomyces malaysiensis]